MAAGKSSDHIRVWSAEQATRTGHQEAPEPVEASSVRRCSYCGSPWLYRTEDADLACPLCGTRMYLRRGEQGRRRK